MVKCKKNLLPRFEEMRMTLQERRDEVNSRDKIKDEVEKIFIEASFKEGMQYYSNSIQDEDAFKLSDQD